MHPATGILPGANAPFEDCQLQPASAGPLDELAQRPLIGRRQPGVVLAPVLCHVRCLLHLRSHTVKITVPTPAFPAETAQQRLRLRSIHSWRRNGALSSSATDSSSSS